MFKKAAIALIVLIVLGAAGGYFYSHSTAGAPAASLEAHYLTEHDRFVEIDGVRLRVREEGPQDAPAFVLIHGFTHSLETWDGWAAALKGDYRVIRYDLPGHGLTGPDPKKRYAPGDHAAFVGAVMDALEIERAMIAGNSLGGLAAWRFAAAQPARVDALVLVSPGGFPANGAGSEPVKIPAALEIYLLTAPEAGVRASAETIYADDSKITDERVAVMRDMIRREGNGAALVETYEQFTLNDPAEALAGIAAPTLILWGEEDLILPVEQGGRMAALMPNAQLITYPGVGHSAQEEAPARSAADAVAFLNALQNASLEGAE